MIAEGTFHALLGRVNIALDYYLRLGRHLDINRYGLDQLHRRPRIKPASSISSMPRGRGAVAA